MLLNEEEKRVFEGLGLTEEDAERYGPESEEETGAQPTGETEEQRTTLSKRPDGPIGIHEIHKYYGFETEISQDGSTIKLNIF